MSEERTLRPLSSYLEFGWRLHREDFSQLTGGVLVAYLPLSILALFIQSPVESIFKSADQALALLPRIFASQMVLRVLETFVLILVILRVEARRTGDQNVWDISGTFSRLRRVAAVDLAYFIGIQIIGSLVFWLALTLISLFIGVNLLSFSFAISVAAFVTIGGAVRYYFASLVSLLHGSSFLASFRQAESVSPGSERLIITIAIVYTVIRYLVWPSFYSVFGSGILGQALVQAGIITISISYYLAGYLLYLDLIPASRDQVTISQEAIDIVPDETSPDE